MDTKIFIKYVPINLLHPSPVNPRHWSDKAKEDLKASITRFGLTEPLLVNAHSKHKNRIISGHFRWTIAKELGIETVPVVYINVSSDKKERELLLRMNANQGAWDFDLLKSFDIDLLLNIGFDDTDLSHVWDDTLETEDDDFDVDKAVKEATKTNIKVGDIFRLGTHTLACGDSTDATLVRKVLGNTKVDVVNTDVPYNIGLNYSKGIGGKQAYGGRTNDKKTDAEYREFVKKIMQSGLAVAKPDAHFFFWSDERYVGMMQELYKELSIRFKRLCMWLKDNQNPTPQVAFNKVTEFCTYGTIGKPHLSDKVKNLNEIINKEVGSGNRLSDDIMDMFNIWLSKRLAGNSYEHPTSKPPTLYEKSLRRCSKVGSVILDLTAGSGSLLIASEQLKRTAYAVEIEPVFCQVIINRYEKLTNNKAKKIN